MIRWHAWLCHHIVFLCGEWCCHWALDQLLSLCESERWTSSKLGPAIGSAPKKAHGSLTEIKFLRSATYNIYIYIYIYIFFKPCATTHGTTSEMLCSYSCMMLAPGCSTDSISHEPVGAPTAVSAIMAVTTKTSSPRSPTGIYWIMGALIHQGIRIETRGYTYIKNNVDHISLYIVPHQACHLTWQAKKELPDARCHQGAARCHQGVVR